VKKFLVRLAVFTVFILAFDKLFIYVRNAAPSLEVDHRLNRILNGKIQKDLLIFGSSRGARGVLAEQIEDSTGVSSFNLSYPGSNIIFHEFLLRQLLTNKGNKIPKKIILIMDDYGALQRDKTIKFRLDRLYPLVKYRTIRDELVVRKDKKSIINELLVLHQLNKSAFQFRKRYFTKTNVLLRCGSMPINHQEKTFDKKYNHNTVRYNPADDLPKKLKAFSRIQGYCASNKIQLILVIPPNFRKPTVGLKEHLIALAKPTTKVWTFSLTNKAYLDADIFSDNGHLRKKGATIFTNDIIHFLEKECQLNALKKKR
jgi:hypothetical protein